MLAAILREVTDNEDEVLATKGNCNNDIGMPLTLLQVAGCPSLCGDRNGHEPSERDRLSHAHCRTRCGADQQRNGRAFAGLGSVEGVALAKGEIFAGLANDGTAVINADDAHVLMWRLLAGTRRVFDFGLDHAAAVKGKWKLKGYGGVLEMRTPAGEIARVELQVPGEHNARKHWLQQLPRWRCKCRWKPSPKRSAGSVEWPGGLQLKQACMMQR